MVKGKANKQKLTKKHTHIQKQRKKKTREQPDK